MPAPDSILHLVETFKDHFEHYKSGKYNETQLRREFLDPFFKALGWDIDNKAGYADAYKDVIHEDAIKIGGSTKAPDYCFRIGGTRKFFLEAKKPSIDVKSAIQPAFQLRRYAWSAKLPLSILSDFEEFAVYDTRIKPASSDKSATARTFYCTFKQYEEKWDDIAAIFSRDAVLKGSFDKYAEGTKKKRGTAEVDDSFLAEIERWRELLAKNFAQRNSQLSIRDLNYAVQKTIDRLIFLRICEDRGSEDYGRLQNLVKGVNTYSRLFDLFRKADDRYNSGLFHFSDEKGHHGSPDTLTPELSLDDKILKDILKNLYYPDSPYEFSVLPADILGQVYEQFLGKTISLTVGHKARIEEKPEVRKAGGVYYTPKYIVDYIVEHTLGKLLNGANTEKPKPIPVSKTEKIKILDPACGSGSFLIVAYQYLLEWHRDQYTIDPITSELDKGKIKRHAGGKNPKIYQAPGGEYRLTTSERKRILLNNIYGVDIDSQAVEVTKLSLLLKVLEGETQQTLQRDFLTESERILPDLGNNICCGNSLIGLDLYEDDQMLLLDENAQYRINVFDWHKAFPKVINNGGFDCVIGNPPYRRVVEKEQIPYFKSHYTICEGRIDLFELFIEKAARLCAINGYFSFIVPAPVLTNQFSRKIRNLISQTNILKKIVTFSIPIFNDPTVHTCVFVSSRSATGKDIGETEVLAGIKHIGELHNSPTYKVSQDKLLFGNNKVINVFITPKVRNLLDRLQTLSIPLGDLCHMRQCIKTGDDNKYLKLSATLLDPPWKRTLQGRGMNRYEINEQNLWVKYGPWLARNWQNPDFYERPKIAIRETGSQLTATFDSDNRYFLSSLYSVYFKNNLHNESLSFLLGILNSEFASSLASIFALSATKGAFTKFRTNQLAPLPIRIIDFENPDDVAMHNKMVALVERILELQLKKVDESNPETLRLLETQISATDHQIDRLVYDLYEITPEEMELLKQPT